MSFIKNNYSTLLSQAKANVVGFAMAYAQFLERVSINQCSPSLISVRTETPKISHKPQKSEIFTNV
jgi:hypothetical protein